jgi:hypothetical protein
MSRVSRSIVIVIIIIIIIIIIPNVLTCGDGVREASSASGSTKFPKWVIAAPEDLEKLVGGGGDDDDHDDDDDDDHGHGHGHDDDHDDSSAGAGEAAFSVGGAGGARAWLLCPPGADHQPCRPRGARHRQQVRHLMSLGSSVLVTQRVTRRVGCCHLPCHRGLSGADHQPGRPRGARHRQQVRHLMSPGLSFLVIRRVGCCHLPCYLLWPVASMPTWGRPPTRPTGLCSTLSTSASSDCHHHHYDHGHDDDHHHRHDHHHTHRAVLDPACTVRYDDAPPTLRTLMPDMTDMMYKGHK